VLGIFEKRVLQTVCLSWSRTEIFLISAPWVARITGVSHWCPAGLPQFCVWMSLASGLVCCHTSYNVQEVLCKSSGPYQGAVHDTSYEVSDSFPSFQILNFWDSVFLFSPSWFGTCSLPTLASQALGLQVFVPTPGGLFFLPFNILH
jgi:hypothetical protein